MLAKTAKKQMRKAMNLLFPAMAISLLLLRLQAIFPKQKKVFPTTMFFLRNMTSESSIMISIDPIAKKGGGGSKPSISYDGVRIAFYSNTDALVVDDKNGLWDIFYGIKTILNLKG